MKRYDMISARQARSDVSDNNALLVCGHEDEKQFSDNALEGAISLKEFNKGKATIAKDREIIVYCDSLGNGVSADQAEKLVDHGFSNVKVIKDGIKAWKDEGFPFML
ncbi:MAG: rhodanese-like domain-containing protein [Desulfobulbaceae bacterium]|nr:rhodanese-like domain-containing protein [Desulfobulbaceae bacterium]